MNCEQQPPGRDVCGYFVCENIRFLTSERPDSVDPDKLHVRKQNSQFYFITIICVEFHSTYTYHIYLLTVGSGAAPTRTPHTSTSRGNRGISVEGGP